ncbi:MAG: hypothetical protein ACI90V_002075, partial [Bacillariaceae sp.]
NQKISTSRYKIGNKSINLAKTKTKTKYSLHYYCTIICMDKE